VRQARGEGKGSGHRAGGNWAVTVRDAEHPVTKGMPAEWMHGSDELYDNMRGADREYPLAGDDLLEGNQGPRADDLDRELR
jgi:hypothetical protein